jgi:GUN4-like
MTDLNAQAILTQLAEIKQQISQLTQLNEKVIQLEETLLLVSDIHRYEKLKNSLATGDWFEADLETINILLEIAGTDQDNLSPEAIQTLPINALKVIDTLWKNYSQGKFGFTVQLKCYQELGGSRQTTITNDRRLIEKWGEKLGWRQKDQWLKCEELDYSLNAPAGCHPSQWWNSPYGAKMTNYFLARLIEAKL